MIIGRKRYCDKCGKEIEHNFFHTLEWFDSYEHTHETKHMAAEVCNGCYEKAFHYILQAGTEIEGPLFADKATIKQKEEEIKKHNGLNTDLWDAVKKSASGTGESQPAVVRYMEV